VLSVGVTISCALILSLAMGVSKEELSVLIISSGVLIASSIFPLLIFSIVLSKPPAPEAILSVLSKILSIAP
jgi:hypothetical protein